MSAIPRDAEPEPRGLQTRTRVTRWLALFVGVAFVVLGVVEVAVIVRSNEPVDPAALAWWFTALCGGGTMVLLGTFAISRAGWALAAVVIGCLLGIVATAWTIALPVAAVTLVALQILETDATTKPARSSVT